MATKKGTTRRTTATRRKKKRKFSLNLGALRGGVWAFWVCAIGVGGMYLTIKRWEWSLHSVAFLCLFLSLYAFGNLLLLGKAVRRWVVGMLALLWVPLSIFMTYEASTTVHRLIGLALFLICSICGVLLIYKDTHKEEE